MINDAFFSDTQVSSVFRLNFCHFEFVKFVEIVLKFRES